MVWLFLEFTKTIILLLLGTLEHILIQVVFCSFPPFQIWIKKLTSDTLNAVHTDSLERQTTGSGRIASVANTEAVVRKMKYTVPKARFWNGGMFGYS